MTQPKDFAPIRPSVWGLTTTGPLLQRLCEEDPQARGLLDVVVTLRIIPHGIVNLAPSGRTLLISVPDASPTSSLHSQICQR